MVINIKHSREEIKYIMYVCMYICMYVYDSSFLVDIHNLYFGHLGITFASTNVNLTNIYIAYIYSIHIYSIQI